MQEHIAGEVCHIGQLIDHDGDETRHEIHDEGHRQQNEMGRLNDRLCGDEKDALRASYEGKLQTLQTENKIVSLLDERTDALSKQICECCCKMGERMNTLELNMNEKFCQLEKRELLETIARQKDELIESRIAAQTAAIIAGVHCHGNGGN